MMKKPPVLYRILGVVSQAADAIYRHYGDNLAGIEEAGIPELKSLKGVGEQSGLCAYTFLHGPAYELWYNQNVRPPYLRKTEYEVLGKVLGRRIAGILETKRIKPEKISEMKLEELQSLESIRLVKRRKAIKTRISHREARKIYDYFHLTGYEFHTRMKETPGKKQKKQAEYQPSYPDEFLNKLLGVISEKEVIDWRKEIRRPEVYKEFVNFERFICHFNQNNRPDGTTIELPKMFIDLRNYAYSTFDSDNTLENKFIGERPIENIAAEPKYKSILEKLREMF